MTHHPIDRREFIREGTTLLAVAATGAHLRGAEKAGEATAPNTIVNYNPKMRYRRLGKTNLMISEVSLGGHWKNRGGGGFWGEFAQDKVPDDVAKNRTEVVSACIDAGMNYLDITTAAECLAYGVALKGRRDKMIVGADDHMLCPRSPANRNVKTQLKNIDECLRRLQTDYLDIWRVQSCQNGSNTEADVEITIEAFAQAHQAGKVKHFGISVHARPWAQRMIEKYPQVEMFIFPCTAKTREQGKPATNDNVEEGNMPPAWSSDQSKSIFQTVREKDIGLVTIKPFVGGNLFDQGGNFPVLGAGSKAENDLARLTLQCILANPAITAVVAGLTTVYEAENAARASYERLLGMSPHERSWLARVTEERWTRLPAEYQWLHDWEVV